MLLFFVKPQHESAIGTHMSPPSWTFPSSPSPSHPSRLIQSPCFGVSWNIQQIPFFYHFTYGNVSFMGSQRVGHDWALELNWTECKFQVTLSIRLTLSSPVPVSIVYSVCLFLHCCPANIFFSAIFLNSIYMHSLQFSRSVVSDSLRPHESQHARPPCPSPTPRVHSDSCPSSQWCHPAISSVGPFSSCPQSLSASESFPMSQLFAWVGH